MQLLLISYLTGELWVDGLDVSFSAVIPQLDTNGPLHSHPDRPGYLVQGGNQLLSLLCTAAGVEDGPDIQWDLRTRWGGQAGENTNQCHNEIHRLDPKHGVCVGVTHWSITAGQNCGGILDNADVVEALQSLNCHTWRQDIHAWFMLTNAAPAVTVLYCNSHVSSSRGRSLHAFLTIWRFLKAALHKHPFVLVCSRKKVLWGIS